MSVENPCKEIVLKNKLSSYTTSELLNEVYKRGAIVQSKHTRFLDKTILEDSHYYNQVLESLKHDALIMAKHNMDNFGVFNLGKKDLFHQNTVEMSIDYFICKHPLALKASE